jgi:ribosomal protein S26
MLLKCSKCGYEWNYKGRCFKATCPNCGKKVPTTSLAKKRKGVRRSTIAQDVEQAKAIIKQEGRISEPQLFLKLGVGINKFYWIKKILQQDPEIEVEDGTFSAKKKLSEAVERGG